jgi:hypothetical protein
VNIIVSPSPKRWTVWMTVGISPRAGRKKSISKRRLASDLYNIMMGDTTEKGFNMEPTSEDSMDH